VATFETLVCLPACSTQLILRTPLPPLITLDLIHSLPLHIQTNGFPLQSNKDCRRLSYEYPPSLTSFASLCFAFAVKWRINKYLILYLLYIHGDESRICKVRRGNCIVMLVGAKGWS
jgi:hypothetical protein